MLRRVAVAGMLVMAVSAAECYAWEGRVANYQGVSFYGFNGAENAQFTWTGTIMDGRLEGYGLQQFYAADGRKLGSYRGYMTKGYREGYGVFSWNDYRYDGLWHQGYFHGQGRLTWGSGIYLGEFACGRPNGYGVRVTEGGLEAGIYENGDFLHPVLKAGYFIIGFCSPSREEAEAEAGKHRELGLHPTVIRTADWSNLTPGVCAVIYGVLDSEEEVQLLKGFRLINGIPYYIKYSGFRQAGTEDVSG